MIGALDLNRKFTIVKSRFLTGNGYPIRHSVKGMVVELFTSRSDFRTFDYEFVYWVYGELVYSKKEGVYAEDGFSGTKYLSMVIKTRKSGNCIVAAFLDYSFRYLYLRTLSRVFKIVHVSYLSTLPR